MAYRPCLVISAEHYAQRSVLRLEGELDLTNEERLQRAISQVLEHHPTLLVVDLTALRFMDCSALSVLVSAHNCLAASYRRLLVTGAQPMVRRLMQLRGLDTWMLFPAQEESPDPGDGLPLTSAPS